MEPVMVECVREGITGQEVFSITIHLSDNNYL